MINIWRDLSISYTKKYELRCNLPTNAVLYPNLFSGEIADKIKIIQRKKDREKEARIISCISSSLGELFGRVFVTADTLGNKNRGDYFTASVFLSDGTLKIKRKTEKTFFIVLPYLKGSVMVFGNKFYRDHSFTLPIDCIDLIEENILEKVYYSIDNRLKVVDFVRSTLVPVKKLPVWKQCVQEHIPLGCMLGKGSYGNVYRAITRSNTGDMHIPYAIKLAKLKPEAVKNPYDKNVSSWHEVFILKNIIEPIVRKKICPNLPLMIDNFVCDNCLLKIDGKSLTTPCVTTAVELASGTMNDFLRKKPSIEELYSCLFQIMASLHAIQLHGQVMNFDVKKENILYYDIPSGGYWIYVIHGQEYKVENYGKIFILNDFGISRPMSPHFPLYKSAEEKTFRLGSRFAVVHQGKFIPLDVPEQINSSGEVVRSEKVKWSISGGKTTSSSGAEFRMYRNGLIPKLNVKKTAGIKPLLVGLPETSAWQFFLDPEKIPPFEFYNDTQDAIRMFTGGKRTTQKGHHSEQKNVPGDMVAKLRPFLGPSDGMKNRKFSTDPSQVLAGYFIEKFFDEYRLGKEKTKEISRYILS